MQKGFGGGIPSFLKNEVSRMNSNQKLQSTNLPTQAEETKEKNRTSGKKSKTKRANGEGWEEFKEPKRDDKRINSNAEKINV